MPEAAVTFTAAENECFNRLFDGIQRVLNTEEYRLVDPLGRIACLFEDEDGAIALLKRLVTMGLMEFIFIGPENGDGRRRETYRVNQDRWLDAATRVQVVPDPPLAAEERLVRQAVARSGSARAALTARREALLKELAEVERGIADADRKIEEAQKLGAELAALRERVAKLGGNAE